MRDENARMWDQLAAERRKVEKLVSVVGRLWDVVGMRFPGSGASRPPSPCIAVHLTSFCLCVYAVPPFPTELLEAAESPNIYITSPTSTSRYPPPLATMGMHTMHTLGSPNSSPTAADFPAPQQQQQQQHQQHHAQQQQHPHALSRQHSFQHPHGGFRGDAGGGAGSGSGPPGQQGQQPPSPGSALAPMDLFDDGGAHDAPSGRGSAKRQRLDERSMGVNGTPGGSGDALALMSSVSSPGGGGGGGASSLAVPKKSSRARSDSAPLGYATPVWQQGGGLGPGGGVGTMGRPRSGSGMMPRGVPNIGNMTRANNASTPLLSITTADADIGR
ncbi:hypothetical protein HYPSUDRAFT_62614 [Hypholoma sublateritium FD-334 SS-4]|uniref:Uncharacterized protein n=1 Tax=Hypholoma sublateritium (strain FD-334 SS-4) TaxID=945553 RepID=A0A0D2Q9A6_HYPSF|nr:hypothetical protein HYPSUDRAFT_62614 [Hypholoma sublateritium FD-334 SS-4]